MAENNMISWVKDPSIPKTYSFRLSSKLMGKLKRKGIWSPDGSGEIGNRKLRFVSRQSNSDKIA